MYTYEISCRGQVWMCILPVKDSNLLLNCRTWLEEVKFCNRIEEHNTEDIWDFIPKTAKFKDEAGYYHSCYVHLN